MTTLYGTLPADLGLIDLRPTEMLFWMYCPISVPGKKGYLLPDNLKAFAEIVSAVKADDPVRFEDSYVYLTAKTQYLMGANMNRPGWHADGFGTDDLNYIWSDRAPTEFVDALCVLSPDCDESMRQMAAHARGAAKWEKIRTYPDRHLLKLDQRVIHRAAEDVEPGIRTFVKVSLSADPYNLVGNARNHLLPETHWPLRPRRAERNHPQAMA